MIYKIIKNWSAWLKGGVISALIFIGIYFLLFLAMKIVNVLYLFQMITLRWKFALLIWGSIIKYNLIKPGIIFWEFIGKPKFISFITIFSATIVFYFIVGILIGLIISWIVKIRTRKNLEIKKKIIKKISSKKAQGHIEIILSFLLFISALMFIFIFMNPLYKNEKPLVENIQYEIIENISSEIGKLSVILNENGICYEFIKTDYVNSEINYKEIQILDTRKYDIYFSDIFETESSSKKFPENSQEILCKVDSHECIDCNANNYTLGVYSKEKIIVYEKIQKLKEFHENSYNKLRTELGILNNFMFTVKDIEGNEISELTVSKDIPQTIDVESREYPIRVINNLGYFEEYILNIKAW